MEKSDHLKAMQGGSLKATAELRGVCLRRVVIVNHVAALGVERAGRIRIR